MLSRYRVLFVTEASASLQRTARNKGITRGIVPRVRWPLFAAGCCVPAVLAFYIITPPSSILANDDGLIFVFIHGPPSPTLPRIRYKVKHANARTVAGQSTFALIVETRKESRPWKRDEDCLGLPCWCIYHRRSLYVNSSVQSLGEYKCEYEYSTMNIANTDNCTSEITIYGIIAISVNEIASDGVLSRCRSSPPKIVIPRPASNA